MNNLHRKPYDALMINPEVFRTKERIRGILLYKIMNTYIRLDEIVWNIYTDSWKLHKVKNWSTPACIV